MLIRKLQDQDMNEMLAMIHDTLYVINSKDYEMAEISRLINNFNEKWLMEQKTYVHFYVAMIDQKIVGCVGLHKINDQQVKLQTLFVSSKYQKQHIATSLLMYIQNDEYYLNSNELILDASISALTFYLKLGFEYQNTTNMDEDGLYALKLNIKKQMMK